MRKILIKKSIVIYGRPFSPLQTSSEPCIRLKFSKEPLDYVVEPDGVEGFIALLRHAHQRILPKKESSGLISPAAFDPTPSAEGKMRGTNNIVFLRNIWLDFEGGDL